MTVPGAGGQVPPRPDQAGIAQAAGQPSGVVVAPGGKPVTRVTQLIVAPGGVLQGIFTYSSSPPAAGTLIESASVASAGTDAYGNHFVTGHASYGSVFAAALNAGVVQFYTGSLSAGWTVGAEVETSSLGDLLLLARSGRQVTTNNNTLDDGSGNFTAAGTGTFSGAGISVGNGAAASVTLNPKMATPPNYPLSGSSTTAQIAACVNGIISSLQNRQMMN